MKKRKVRQLPVTGREILEAVTFLEASLDKSDYERTIRLRAALRYLESALKELK